MFDIGMTELLVIGIVALIVVGPKDLPGMFRQLGRFTGKMRGMAREFQRAMEDAADEAGASDIKKGIGDVKSWSNPKKMGLDKLNEATSDLRKWDPEGGPKGAGPEVRALAKERQSAAARAHEAATARRAAPLKETGTAAESPLDRAAPASTSSGDGDA